MDDKLAEVIDAHIQGVALQKSAQESGQYRHIIEDGRGVHDYTADDRPEVAYVAEEDVQRAEKHTNAEVYEKQADYRVNKQKEVYLEGNAVDCNENEEYHKRYEKIDEIRNAVREQKVQLGHGHLAVNGRIYIQNAHGVACDVAEIVKQQKTREKVDSVVRQVKSEESTEHDIHRDKQKQRCKRTPQNAERGALIFFDKVSSYKLREQKAIGRFFCHMNNSP